jgi:methyl-accepting chemotaxis protein
MSFFKLAGSASPLRAPLVQPRKPGRGRAQVSALSSRRMSEMNEPDESHFVKF